LISANRSIVVYLQTEDAEGRFSKRKIGVGQSADEFVGPGLLIAAIDREAPELPLYRVDPGDIGRRAQ
jgi:hypothetical protein